MMDSEITGIRGTQRYRCQRYGPHGTMKSIHAFSVRKEAEITKYFERISQQHKRREQDVPALEDPTPGPSDERRGRMEDMRGGFGRSGEEESSASVGGKPLGRPPVAASGLRAGRPQLGRNPEASTKPNKPGRQPRGALSEAEKRMRSLLAGEQVAQADFTEFVRSGRSHRESLANQIGYEAKLHVQITHLTLRLTIHQQALTVV